MKLTLLALTLATLTQAQRHEDPVNNRIHIRAIDRGFECVGFIDRTNTQSIHVICTAADSGAQFIAFDLYLPKKEGELYSVSVKYKGDSLEWVMSKDSPAYSRCRVMDKTGKDLYSGSI